jgi:hypothetical protein
MPTARKIVVVAAVSAAVVGGALWLWWRSQQAPGLATDGAQPDGQNNATATPKWDDSSGGACNAGVYLLPVGPKEARRRPAPEVWKTLLTGLADDSSTKALLRRLYNDLPVDFVVLPDEAAKDQQSLDRAGGPPGTEFSVVVRVAAEQPLQELGGGDWFASLGCRRDMRVKPGEKSANFVDKDGSAVSSRPPRDFAVLLLAMNDYLLRTGAGYAVFDGGPSTPQGIRSAFPTHDLEAMRADLERRMADYLNGYRASTK